MIVVDGRTDIEKLEELMQSPEETHLEFKEFLDLSDKETELKFVKDAIAMSNRPPGGYILVGVDDDGNKSMPTGTISDRSMFDGARLGDKLRKYIEGEIHPISQIHEIDQHEIVLIYLPHPRDGLPIPLKTDGQFTGKNRKSKTEFRKGEIYVREGPQNVHIRHAHWNDLLSKRDERIRSEARSVIDALITEITSAIRMGNLGEGNIVPLSTDLADHSLSEAVLLLLEQNKDIRIAQFVKKASQSLSNPETRRNALQKIVIVASQAIYSGRNEIAIITIDELKNAYDLSKNNAVFAKLDFVTYIYVLGSLAVRQQQWAVVRNLALRPVHLDGSTYTYPSWIRHAQVEASRADLFPDKNSGLMISEARNLMNQHPELRPDVDENSLSNRVGVTEDDPLLDSLCQFDVYYCLIVNAEYEKNNAGYPASSALRQFRVDPAFETIASNPQARAALFPNHEDRNIAKVLGEFFLKAQQESFNVGEPWYQLPRRAAIFVDEHQY
ncbi:AlbA family DNA-binding domain-containing protein [Corynebacterium casei]|uniref:AlbA family DNA-binding domain-containing protein n=1 Tax=Corynebacterium casei TaxID=160386 RepID=UPI003FD2D5F0